MPFNEFDWGNGGGGLYITFGKSGIFYLGKSIFYKGF